MQVLDLDSVGVWEAFQQVDNAVAKVDESLLGLHVCFQEFAQVESCLIHIFSFI